LVGRGVVLRFRMKISSDLGVDESY
jgi:hypothetical protein